MGFVSDADFLRACPREVRRSLGVYLTPSPVVHAQVRLVDSLLAQRMGCPSGFGDERVLIVDPACGTGAYPLAILDLIDGGTAAKQRVRLYEALPAAAALARSRGLPVTDGDALAADVSFQAPIVVCLGNPPYRRGVRGLGLARNVDDLGAGNGLHLKNIYNEYVYFWRWALRVAFEERVGPGVVCLITPASYLRGPAFTGMRALLRRTLDELWLIDIEGDDRAARASSNVFPIRTPVSIALGVRYGPRSTSRTARVHYTRLEGDVRAKLGTLDRVRGLSSFAWRTVRGGSGEAFVAQGPSAYFQWPALTDLFPWALSGAQLKRTWPIGVTPDVLRERWRHFLRLPADERRAAFVATRDRDTRSSPPDLFDPVRRLAPLDDLPADAPCAEPTQYAYRAFDRQWVLPDSRLGDFPRPALWRSSSPRQVFLTSMLTNVLGPGPAAIATAYVPDLDHFRGSFGARGVIPLWRDATATRPNVSPAWLARLSEQHAFEVTAPDLLAYCYALLAGRGFTRLFAEELRAPGARVPLTADTGLFRRGVQLGESVLAIHTYRDVRVGKACVVSPFSGASPASCGYAGPTLAVGEARIAPVAPEVWAYTVSGYRVLSSWLRRRVRPRGKSLLDRIGPTAWTPGLTRELLDLLWLLEATLALEPALDALLNEIITGPLVSAGPRARRR